MLSTNNGANSDISLWGGNAGRYPREMKKLTIEQLKVARIKALENAQDLICEVQLLYDNRRWPRVVFLCQIAGEELGKHFELTAAVLEMIADGNLNWRKFWKRITSHHDKLKLITHMEDILLYQPFPENYFDQLNRQVHDLEQYKQMSLYSDVTCDTPYLPSEIVTEEVASNALKWVTSRLKIVSELERRYQETQALDTIRKEDIERIQQQFGLTEFFAKRRCKKNLQVG